MKERNGSCSESEVLEKEIRENWSALCLLPESLKTSELCRLAAESWKKEFDLFRERIFFSKAICDQMAALFYRIPASLKTLELCRLVVEENGRALEYVPELLKTEELCRLAVKDGWAWSTCRSR